MRLLVIRNSALGDVAMVRPCLVAMQTKFPKVEIDLLTKPQFWELFDDLKNVQLIDTEYEGKHKGATGLLRLAKSIHQNYDIDKVWICMMWFVQRSSELILPPKGFLYM